MKMKIKDKGELIVPMIVIGLSVFLYIDTYSFQFMTYQKAGPQMWPRGILILLILISLMLIGKLLAAGNENREKPKTNIKSITSVMLLLFFYIFLMQYLGYIISTLLFTFFAMLFFGNRNIFQLVCVPVMIVAFIFLAFNYAMFIPLPKGVGIFRNFTLIFQ